jgi:ribosome maturation factor RimP
MIFALAFDTLALYIMCVVEIARNGLFLFPWTLPMDERLQKVVEESAERHGAHLVDLVLRGHAGRAVVEVYVDNESGVTTELCAEVSRAIAAAVDQHGLLSGSYRLDVSSPGIDRPLKYRWQFRKHLGRKLRIRRKMGDTVLEVRGTFTGMDEQSVSLEVAGIPSPVVVPFESVVEARVQTPW